MKQKLFNLLGPATCEFGTLLHKVQQHSLPEINVDNCVGCYKCIDFCPVALFERDNRKVKIMNLVFCKECGICSEVCPKKCITMVEKNGRRS